MKKKTMQALFVALFITGLVIGFLVPWDIRDAAREASKKSIQPNVFDVPKKLGQLELESPYFKYSVLAEADTGGVELIRVDDKIPMHVHAKENHFVYIYKGRAKGTVGSVTAEVGPGQLVAIPAGVPHSLERIGDTPVEIILFSTPPFVPADIKWIEQK